MGNLSFPLRVTTLLWVVSAFFIKLPGRPAPAAWGKRQGEAKVSLVQHCFVFSVWGELAPRVGRNRARGEQVGCVAG